jgi:hypothetical protein
MDRWVILRLIPQIARRLCRTALCPVNTLLDFLLRSEAYLKVRTLAAELLSPCMPTRPSQDHQHVAFTLSRSAPPRPEKLDYRTSPAHILKRKSVQRHNFCKHLCTADPVPSGKSIIEAVLGTLW